MRIDSARYLLSAIARADGCKRGFAPVKGRGCQRAKFAQEGAPVQEQPRRKKEGLLKKLVKPKNILLASAGLAAAYGTTRVVSNAIHRLQEQDKEILGDLDAFFDATANFHTESPEVRSAAISVLEGIAENAKASHAPRSRRMAEKLLEEYRKKDKEALAAEEKKREGKREEDNIKTIDVTPH